MDNKRSTLKFKDHDLFIDMIYNLIPDKRLMLLRAHPYYEELRDKNEPFKSKTLISVTVQDESMFNRIKFEFIKFIKTLKNPENRVADWEWRDKDGLPDWDKLERLVEKRKTREEKAKEFNDELQIKKDCERFGVEYFGPLRDL